MEKIRLENLDRSGLHDFFESYFPAPYGRNLDALHDILSSLSTPLTIELDEASLLGKLGDRYYDSLLRMFRDTAEENPNLTILA
ncbi:MAG: barstar family protein [Oscillospiraceae bacterium]|nr:barstar family protein [Oscillospiraceae bacterium]